MKTTLLLLVVIAATALSSFAASPEETLAKLQIQEAALKTRFRSGSPQIQDIQAQIMPLQAIPKIQNDKYFECLRDSLLKLQSERAVLAEKYRTKSPKIVDVDAQITFIQSKLDKNAG